MILTVCPNPSIDCTIELESLNVGMLNKIQGKVETYSGKALNVAIGVSRLGCECLSTGFMFENQRRTFEHVLEKEGVVHDFVRCVGNTRVNYKIIDKRSMLTEINDVGEEVSAEKQAELLVKTAKLSEEADIAVISGSLPKGVSSDFYGEMAKAVSKRARLVVDAEKGAAVVPVSGVEFSIEHHLTVLPFLDQGIRGVHIVDAALIQQGKELLFPVVVEIHADRRN